MVIVNRVFERSTDSHGRESHSRRRRSSSGIIWTVDKVNVLIGVDVLVLVLSETSFAEETHSFVAFVFAFTCFCFYLLLLLLLICSCFLPVPCNACAVLITLVKTVLYFEPQQSPFYKLLCALYKFK